MDRREWILSRCTKEDKILDIGSADGWIFRNTGLNVSYCDINEFNIPNFTLADAQNLPFEDNSFDICAINEVIEHAANPVACLKEAARVCRKKVVFTTPNEAAWTPDKKPFMTIEQRLAELGGNITAGQLYMRDNQKCIKLHDEASTYHHRWYDRKLLEEHLRFINLPYKIDLLDFDGWSFFIGEIYKDRNIPLREQAEQILNQRMARDGYLINPAPAPSVIGHIKYSTLPQPRSLHVDTWSFCNGSCQFCRYNTLTRPKGKMDMKLLEHILDDVATWPRPLEEIVPIHYGEFFTNPDWYEVLKLIETKLPQTAIVLATNGSMLTPQTVAKLTTIRTLKILNISVNAFYRETYEQLMGLSADTILNVKEAIRYLKVLMSPITVWISMVYDPALQTEKEKDLFEQEWRPYGTVFTHPASFCQDYRKPAIVSKIPCRSIYIDFVVLWTGECCMCCWDANGENQVGDVKSESVMQIWHGEKFNKLRERHNGGKRDEIPVCKECTFS